MTMIRLPASRMTDATRFTLTPQGRAVLAAAPTCPGCPRCGLPLPEVTGLNSSLYECIERRCYFEQAGRDLSEQAGRPLPPAEVEAAP